MSTVSSTGAGLVASAEIRLMRLKARVKRWVHGVGRPQSPWLATCDAQLTFLVGERHVPMLRHTLASLRRHEPQLPRLIIAADTQLAAQRIAALDIGNTPDVRLCLWNTAFELLPLEIKHFVERYVSHPRWSGFGKKLALIASLNTTEDTLYCDTDMLWYAPALEDILRLLHSSYSRICIGTDYQQSYDKDLLSHLAFTFSSSVALNTGFLALGRGVLVDALGHARMANWSSYRGPFGCHTEQTLIACAADCVGAQQIPQSIVGISMIDAGRFRRHFTPRVRHYVGPKTLYWRDC